MTSAETLFHPKGPPPKTTTRFGSRTLSPEVLRQGVGRIRGFALLYAFTFFMSAFFSNLFVAEDRARMLEAPIYWLPDVIAIAGALGVAYFVGHRRVSLRASMNIGIAFMVASSYGIAIAEFIDPVRLDNNGWIGLSWVAVWTPLFLVAVPTPPLRALPAILVSVSAVPVMIGYMVLSHRTTFQPPPAMFFFAIVFPYLLVAMFGYVSARVVYALGKQVMQAQELGSYQLVELLGRGGMGEVWRANHRLLARPAAIKVIRTSSGAAGQTGSADADAVRRFEREAQVTARLRSPHTVELWDFGVNDEGAFYYVMELLDGLDLHTLVNQYGPVPAERAIHLVRQVCHSLAEAEENGLVHRDIKPANIMVSRYGGDADFVKVLDFGIVKATSSALVDTAMLATRESSMPGTPAFIAPEQALGSANIDGRADLYATGCVLYWLLTGQLVFAAETSMGIALHHAQTVPTPPSARTELPIPPELDALILSCLAKSPADRPQCARELADRLAAIATPTSWTNADAREWWRRHRPG